MKTITDLLSSLKTTITFKIKTLKLYLTNQLIINSQIFPSKNTKLFTPELKMLNLKDKQYQLSDMNHKLTQLTGEPKGQYQELKIKDNVDHVGHFQLSVHLKALMQYSLVIWQNFHNKVWLIVQRMELIVVFLNIKVAKED